MLNPPNPVEPTLHQPLHSKVSNYLNDQRRQGHYCDLVIELESCENDPVYAHFCVVAAQSQFIGGSRFLQKTIQFSIHNPLKVTIKDFSCYQCLQTIVDFFYEDVVSIATEHETHFRRLAKILSVTELLNLFEEYEEPALAHVADGTLCDIGTPEKMGGNLMTIADNLERHDELNGVVVDSIFGDTQTYFKLKNTRSSNSNSKINYCIGCDFKCYRVHEMISHMSSCEASNLTCSLCEVGFLGWREYDAHLRKHSSDMKKPFFCLECDVRFMTRAALLVHFPKHSAETPHLCPHCNKGFKWKHGLNNHLLIHNKEKLMLCDVCGYSTTHMKALKSHKLQHTADFFKCPYPGCKHRANRKENMKLHIETHKQERPFVCEVCGCKFSQSKNLKRHALKHSTDDIKKHKCQLCSFSSHRTDKVKEHMQRVHTEKVMQLELPEVVENSFENNVNDVFVLPTLPIERQNANDAKQEHGEKSAVRKVRKRKEKSVIVKRLRTIVPKTDKLMSE